MANYMKDVAKMLGVELDEEFKITNDDYVYRITKDRMEYKSCSGWHDEIGVLLMLLKGEVKIVKLPWQPKYGETYYRPCAAFKDVTGEAWINHPIDFAFKAAGMTFKTRDECEAALPELCKKYLGGGDVNAAN